MLYSLFTVEPKLDSGRLGLVSCECGMVCWGSGACFPAIFVCVRSGTVVLCRSYLQKPYSVQGNQSQHFVVYQRAGAGEFEFISDIDFIAMLCIRLWLFKQFRLSTDFIFLNNSVMQYATIFKGNSWGSCSFVSVFRGSTWVQLFWLNRVKG